jgi:hypothetical protein
VATPKSQLSDANVGGCRHHAAKSGHTWLFVAFPRKDAAPVGQFLSVIANSSFQSEVSMDFDPRWGDDPRDRDDRGRELSHCSRGGLSNPREREPLDARDVFTRDLELPRGREAESAAAT